MKKLAMLTILIFCINSILFADVTEKKKLVVSLKKFGTYTSDTESSYSGEKKLEKSDGLFEGKGFFGKMVQAFFPSGKKGEIFKLDEKNVYNLSYDSATYYVTPIEKLFEEEDADVDAEVNDNDDANEEARFKTLREEFKVIDLKEKGEFNQFKIKNYRILMLNETLEIATQIIRTDSLIVNLSMTDEGDFIKANNEKMAFNKKYFELIGTEFNDEYEHMLGLSWINIVKKNDENNGASSADSKKAISELEKLKGYPVVIDGHYYTRKIDPNAPKAEKPKMSGGFGGMFNKIAKSVAANVVSDEGRNYVEQLSYYIETTSLGFDTLAKDSFEVPGNFVQTSN